MQFHPDKTGQEATVNFYEAQAAYEAIIKGKPRSDTFDGIDNEDETCYGSSHRAIWEGPPILSHLCQSQKFSLTMGTLDRFLESRGGKHLGGISQNAVYSSFETQFQTQLDVLNTLDRSPSNAIGAAVGHVLLALKRM